MVTKEKTRNREKAMQTRSKTPAMSPWDEMERWFDEFGRRGWLHPLRWEWPAGFEGVAPFGSEAPTVDVIDRDTEVVVRAELPGVTKEDLDVTMTHDSVTIKAHKKHEEKEEKGEYYRQEMHYGEYQRTLGLPDTVDEGKAKATFENGILELTLPKKEQTQRRTIRVE